MHELILGGARSGKSRLAEERAHASGLALVYLATATAGDGEMSQRIAHHQARRDSGWLLVEETVSLADTLLAESNEDRCIVVDCLTLWLSNCLAGDCWEREKNKLLEALPNLPGQLIFVSNETGLGVVPMGELSRVFVDESGFLHQRLAEHCARVTMTIAGLPLALKPGGTS